MIIFCEHKIMQVDKRVDPRPILATKPSFEISDNVKELLFGHVILKCIKFTTIEHLYIPLEIHSSFCENQKARAPSHLQCLHLLLVSRRIQCKQFDWAADNQQNQYECVTWMFLTLKLSAELSAIHLYR